MPFLHWTVIPAAKDPYTITPSASQMFYRVAATP
jgi:hypothetical protein